jgi:hypothetical protein
MSFFDKLKTKIGSIVDKYIDNTDVKKYTDKLLKNNKNNKKDSFTTDEASDVPVVSDASDTVDAVSDTTSSKIDLIQLFGAQDAPSWVKSILYVFQYLIIPLPIAIFVANEMMMYSPIIRFIFFAFVFGICANFVTIAAMFYIYYILFAVYAYYNNNYTENPKMNWKPYIFAMLPLTVSRPDYPLNGVFFSYGGEKEELDKLKEIMDKYSKDLNESFPYLKEVGSRPEFSENYKKVTNYTAILHAPPPKTEEDIQMEKDLKKADDLRKANPQLNSSLPPTIKNTKIINRIELLSKKEADRTNSEKERLLKYNAENSSISNNPNNPNASNASNALKESKEPKKPQEFFAPGPAEAANPAIEAANPAIKDSNTSKKLFAPGPAPISNASANASAKASPQEFFNPGPIEPVESVESTASPVNKSITSPVNESATKPSAPPAEPEKE